MFEQDYIMRLIKEMVRTLLKLMFNIDVEKIDDVEFDNQENTRYYKNLLDMVDEGMVNEAENILISNLDLSNLNSFQMALMFYNYLNEKDDDFLEQFNYSRTEINDGIKYICKQYGCSGFADLFIDKF